MGCGEAFVWVGFLALPGAVLRGAVDPDPLERLSGEQGSRGAGAGPVFGRGDEAFLAALLEQVAQACDLRFALVTGDDVGVAAAPELLPPVVPPTSLAGDLRVDVAHEVGELLDVLGSQQDVGVVREVDEAADLHVVALLEAGEGADDDGVELGRWAQEEAPLDDAAGDLYEVVVIGQVAEFASHARGDGNRPGILAALVWHLRGGLANRWIVGQDVTVEASDPTVPGEPWPPWLLLNPEHLSGDARAAPGGDGVPRYVSLSFNAAGLTPEVYTAQLSFESEDSGTRPT